jgi:hypothetical protein
MAVVLLVSAYVLLPGVLSLAGLTAALPAFLPRYGGGLVGFALAVAEMSAMAWALSVRSENQERA